MSDQPLKHGAQHTPIAPDGIRYAVWHILLSGDRDDDDPVIAEDNVVRPPITTDMDTYLLRGVELGLGVASSSGAVSIDITNETTADRLLTTDASISSGAQHVDASSAIDYDEEKFVTAGDIIRIDITAAGTDAKGLKAVLVWW